MLTPLLDDDSGLLQAVEDFTVQAFVAQLAIEGLAVAVFPWTARRNVERLCSELCEPVAHDLGRHLRAVVRPDVFRDTFGKHYVGHRLDDTEAVDPASHPDCQAFPGELVDQSHQPQLAPIVGLRLDEVVAPDMVAMLRPQTDAGSVVEPQPATRPLFAGYF